MYLLTLMSRYNSGDAAVCIHSISNVVIALAPPQRDQEKFLGK